MLTAEDSVREAAKKINETRKNVSPEAAIEQAQAWMKEHGLSALVIGELGKAYAATGDEKKARETFTQGLALHPDSTYLREVYAKFEILLGNPAPKDLHAVAEKRFLSQYTAQQMTGLYLSGKPDDAIVIGRRFISANGDYVAILSELSVASSYAGKFTQAKKYLDSAHTKLATDPHVTRAHGIYTIMTGDAKKGVEILYKTPAEMQCLPTLDVLRELALHGIETDRYRAQIKENKAIADLSKDMRAYYEIPDTIKNVPYTNEVVRDILRGKKPLLLADVSGRPYPNHSDWAGNQSAHIRSAVNARG